MSHFAALQYVDLGLHGLCLIGLNKYLHAPYPKLGAAVKSLHSQSCTHKTGRAELEKRINASKTP